MLYANGMLNFIDFAMEAEWEKRPSTKIFLTTKLKQNIIWISSYNAASYTCSANMNIYLFSLQVAASKKLVYFSFDDVQLKRSFSDGGNTKKKI